MLRQSLMITAALSLTACAGHGALTSPPNMSAPAQFASQDATAGRYVETDWVARFNDPQLTALIEEALGASPTILSAQADLARARAGARLAGADRLPSLNAGLDASRSDSDNSAATESYSLGVNASWEADIWQKVADQAKAGHFNAEAAAHDLAAARLSLAGSVAQSWFQVIEARQQTELAQFDVETRQRQLDIVERRFARGVVRSSDVRTARSVLASSQASYAAQQRAEAASVRSLEALLGRYPSATLAHSGDLPTLGEAPTGLTPEGLLSRRPDILAAEARLRSAGYSAEAARKALYPSLTLKASLGNSESDFGEIFSTSNLVNTIAGNIAAPIFNGGALRAQRDQALASAQSAAIDYTRTALAAFQETENALFADQTLAERVAALETAHEEAAAAQELVERQYASGVASIVELLDAQSRVISARSALINARQERASNRVALHMAMAGDFAIGQTLLGQQN